MAVKLFLLAACLACTTLATNEDVQIDGLGANHAEDMAMEKVFVRSEEEHTKSMAAIMETMSPAKAAKVLESFLLIEASNANVERDGATRGR